VSGGDRCVSHHEDAETGIGHHHRVFRQFSQATLYEHRFGDGPGTVLRTDFRQERGSAFEFVRHDQHRHGPDSGSMLIRGRRKLSPQFGLRREGDRGSIHEKDPVSVQRRCCGVYQGLADLFCD
jgi:hypothetical protein